MKCLSRTQRLYSFFLCIICAVVFGSCASTGKKCDQKSDDVSSSPLPYLSIAIPVNESTVRVIVLNTVIKRTTNIAVHLMDNLSVIIDGSRAQNAYKTYLINAAYQVSKGMLPPANVAVFTNYVKGVTDVLMKDAWHINMCQYKYFEKRDEFVFDTTRICFSEPGECENELEKQGTIADWPKLYARPRVQKAMNEYFGKVLF